jgi:hypothetical protein
MKESGFYAVGGFITGGIAALELERSWDKLLKRHRLAYFKASECEMGKRQFAKFVSNHKAITPQERAKLDSISHEFCGLINRPMEHDDRGFLCAFGIGVPQKDFYQLIKDSKARSILGKDPYRLAYDLAMVQCAWTMKEFCKRNPNKHCVSYICDANEEHATEGPAAYLKLKKRNPKAAKYMCAFGMDDEKKCPPLQAADAVVYEIRKVLKFSHKDWETKLRKQFGMMADKKSIFYVGHTRREQLEWIVNNHKPGDTFKLDELMKLRLKENIDTIGV